MPPFTKELSQAALHKRIQKERDRASTGSTGMSSEYPFDQVISNTFSKSQGTNRISGSFAEPLGESVSKSGSPIFEGHPEGWPVRLVKLRGFVVAINLAIVLSAVQMGVQAELGDKAESIVALRVFENFFTGLFVLEMVLKLYVLGFHYFADLWNVLDAAVACVSAISSWVMPWIGMESRSNLSVIKAFRLFRLLRLIKLTNAIPSLRIVVEGLIGSMRALFWVVMLLMLVVYLFAILCVEVIGSSPLGTYPGYSTDPESITSSLSFANFNNFEYFGTVSRAMATLFSMSILAEWDSFRPIWEFQPWCVPIIAMLIFCTTFGIVNVIIGVIVEHTTNSMNEIKFVQDQEEKRVRMDHIQTVAHDLWQSDTDGDGVISRDEMRTAGKDETFVKHFRETDLPKGFTFDDLYDMCNLRGKDGLTQRDFMAGMQRMVFGSDFQKTCLLMLNMGQIKQMNQQMIKEQTSYMELQFARLREDLHAIRAEVQSNKMIGGSVAAAPPSTPWTDHPAFLNLDKSSVEDLRPSQMNAEAEHLFDASASAYRSLQQLRTLSRERIAAALDEGRSMAAHKIAPLSPTIAAKAEELFAECELFAESEDASGAPLEPAVSQRNSCVEAAVDLGALMSSSHEAGGPSQDAASAALAGPFVEAI